MPRGTGGDPGFGFDSAVPHDGYAWWYVDAISDDGLSALTVIAFIGSVFSPYYAGARRRSSADPLNHVSINAILYTPRGKFWAMTERGRSSIRRSRDHLEIGPSRMMASPGRLVIEIDEWTVPLPRRMRGTIEIDLGTVFETGHHLHASGRHVWRPIAPTAEASVAFERPGIAWTGRAYVDMNRGSEPLERGFRAWTWSRSHVGAATNIIYDVAQRDGGARSLSLAYRADGTIEPVSAPPVQVLPVTGWRVARSTRAPAGQPARVVRTLEDTPFYARSLIATGSAERETAVHESVDLDRFASRWVQTLLPFRMPRRAGF